MVAIPYVGPVTIAGGTAVAGPYELLTGRLHGLNTFMPARLFTHIQPPFGEQGTAL